MTHTPGPWHVHQEVTFQTRDDRPSKWYSIVAAGKAIICKFGGLGKDAQANALLIASAPDLLEALKGMMLLSFHKHRYHGTMVCDACVAVKNAHAAIAKAQERKE